MQGFRESASKSVSRLTGLIILVLFHALTIDHELAFAFIIQQDGILHEYSSRKDLMINMMFSFRDHTLPLLMLDSFGLWNGAGLYCKDRNTI